MANTNVGSISYDVRLSLDQLRKDTATAEKIVNDSYKKMAQTSSKASGSSKSSGTSTSSSAAQKLVDDAKTSAQASYQTLSQYTPKIQSQFIAVERANMRVETATIRASNAVQKYGQGSIQAISATNSLKGAVLSQSTAQDRLSTSLKNTGDNVSSSTNLMRIGFAAAATAALALGAAIGSQLNDAVARADTINNFPKVMANFGISSDDATMAMKRLVAGVKGLPTSLNDITSLTESFTPMTGNVRDATTVALAFNDALLASGSPMASQTAAMEQFRQALAKGKPELQDWKSLESAMPAQLQQVGTALGLGSGKLAEYANNGQGLYKSMQDGKLSLSDFSNALVDLDIKGNGVLPSFQQQAKNASTGIGTSFAVLQQNIQQGMVNIFNTIGSTNIQGALGGVGQAFTNTFNVIINGIKFIQQYGNSILPVIATLSTLIGTFGTLSLGILVVTKSVGALRIAMSLLTASPVVAVLSILAAAITAMSFNNITSGLKDTTTNTDATNASLKDLKQQLADANKQYKTLGSTGSGVTDDMAKQFAKLDKQAAKINSDFKTQLAELVQGKQADITALVKQLSDEKKAYDNSYNERLTSFNKSQGEEEQSHQDKVKSLTTQIDFLTKYNNTANNKQLSQLRFSLAQENSAYQKQTDLATSEFQAQTDSAATQYQTQRDERQKQLDDELLLLETHRQDVLSVQGMMLADDIDALKNQRDAQLQSLSDQRNDVLANNSSTNAGLLIQQSSYIESLKQQIATLEESLKTSASDAGKAQGQAQAEGFRQGYAPVFKVIADANKEMTDANKKGDTTGAQKAYQKFLTAPLGFASGGYTGQGSVNEPAGIVHKGEYVLPQEQVNQSTGQPDWSKIGGNSSTKVTINLSGVMTAGKAEERALARRLGDRLNEVLKAQGKPAFI